MKLPGWPVGVAVVSLLAACSEGPVPADVGGPQPALSAAVAARFARHCALCHVDGNAGAPRVGDRAAWQERVAKGYDTLLHNTVEGIGMMPPLGYCMSCEREDFAELIAFMAGQNIEEAP